jgi:hypothetical protein
VSSTKDGGAAFITRHIKTDAGKVAPTKLKHLTAHAMDPLQSLAAQQGMSA